MKFLRSFALLMAVQCCGFYSRVCAADLPTINVPYVLVGPKLSAAANDPTWTAAATIPQLTVAEGDKTKELKAIPTQVKLLWSDNALYVRFICTDDTVYLPEHGHDAPIWKGDVVEVFLDVKGDARQWAELEVNASGDTFDQLAVLTADPISEERGFLIPDMQNRDLWNDLSWELAGWQTKSAMTSTGWIVDMAIPPSVLRRLGQDHFTAGTFRANLIRYKYLPPDKPDAKRHLIPMNWSPVWFGTPHVSPNRMGFLKLLPANPLPLLD